MFFESRKFQRSENFSRISKKEIKLKKLLKTKQKEDKYEKHWQKEENLS